MVGDYTRLLREAWRARGQARFPRFGLVVVAFVVVATTAAIAWATATTPPGEVPEFHFRSETGLVTRLSAFYLGVAAALSLAALAIAFRRREKGGVVWLVLTLGFAFLAADELLQFHERFGGKMKGVAGAGPFRNWNDIAVILYGVFALPVLAALAPTLLRYRMVAELFAVAFTLYAIHTLFDSTSDTATSVIAEESAKLFCGAFLSLAAGAIFVGVLQNREQGPVGLRKTA